MHTPAASDSETLDAHLRSLRGVLLLGVLVGAGSIILNFSNGASLLVQCPFEVFAGKSSTTGHGEVSSTAVILFDLLNERITDTAADRRGNAILRFDASRGIKVRPDESGFESYVLRTAKGVLPVIGPARRASHRLGRQSLKEASQNAGD